MNPRFDELVDHDGGRLSGPEFDAAADEALKIMSDELPVDPTGAGAAADALQHHLLDELPDLREPLHPSRPLVGDGQLHHPQREPGGPVAHLASDGQRADADRAPPLPHQDVA